MLGVIEKFAARLFGGSLSHYDLILAFVPTAFVTSILVGQLLAIPPHTAMAGAAAAAVLAMVDALFLNPPRGPAGNPD